MPNKNAIRQRFEFTLNQSNTVGADLPQIADLLQLFAHGDLACFDYPLRMDFAEKALERNGFVGWVPLHSIRWNDCPVTGGVYVVTCEPKGPVRFADASCGGWFKGRDPSVALEALRANWVHDAEVVYIGKGDNLRRRLKQFADFGAGKPVGHWGGRLIWQLSNIEMLRFAWKETPGRVPREVEAELIASFRHAYGKPPFANEPHRLGA